MNLDLSSLTITDPLEKQDVHIIITLPASEEPKDERSALISVGIANEMPVTVTGILGNIDELLHTAWKQFGVNAEANKATAEAKPAEEEGTPKTDETAVAPELLAEATTEDVPEPEVAAEMATETSAPAPKPKPAPAAPKPAANLSLF